MDTGSLVAASAFVLTGVMCVVLGRLGPAGKIDFNLGLHTRDNTTPESWAEAHRIMGHAMVRSGWIQIAGGIPVAIFGLRHSFGTAGFTLAILGALALLWSLWPTFKVLEKRSDE